MRKFALPLFKKEITDSELRYLRTAAAWRAQAGRVVKNDAPPSPEEIQRALKESLRGRYPEEAYNRLEEIVTYLPWVMGQRVNCPFSMFTLTGIQQDLTTAMITSAESTDAWLKAARFYLKAHTTLEREAKILDERVKSALNIEDRAQRLAALMKMVPGVAEYIVDGIPTHGEMLRLRPSIYFSEINLKH